MAEKQGLEAGRTAPEATARRHHEDLNSEFFDGWALKYDEFRISGWFQYTQRLALEQFDWRDDGRLIDIGCGTGYATLQAAARLNRGRACGIDISPTMIEQASAKVPVTLRDRVEFRVSGAESIPYPDDDFDYALCTNSFHHYQDPAHALNEMRRVLKPGGTLVIFENAPDLSLYTWAWDRFLRLWEKGHVRYYPSRELGRMIADASFENAELRVLRNERFKHGKLFASIQIWAARAPHSVPAGSATA